VFAGGEGEEVVLGEHIGQTAVVCDDGGGDTTVTSDLDNVDFLIKEACIVNVELITPTKAQPPRIRTNTQDEECHCEEEEQERQANRFAERANAMGKKNTVVSSAQHYSDILTRSSSASAHKINEKLTKTGP
jgi:hypothetical protein